MKEQPIENFKSNILGVNLNWCLNILSFGIGRYIKIRIQIDTQSRFPFSIFLFFHFGRVYNWCEKHMRSNSNKNNKMRRRRKKKWEKRQADIWRNSCFNWFSLQCQCRTYKCLKRLCCIVSCFFFSIFC